MALQQTITLESGLDVTDAYIKITHIRVDRANSGVRLKIDVFPNKASSDAGKPPLQSMTETLTGDNYTTYMGNESLNVANQNVIERAYVFLKTTLRFSGAVDA